MRESIKNIIREYLFEAKWNEESLRDEALKYTTRTEFRKKMPGAVDAARKISTDFYNEITSHMPKVTKRKHSEDSLRQEAKKYSRRKEFYDKSQGAYLAAKRLGDDFFEDITSHMEDGRAFQELKWTDEILKKLTSQYGKLSDFRNENPQAYNALLRRGDEKYQDYTSHMDKRRVAYTEDELRQIAKKYKTYNEFSKNDAAALVSAKNKGDDFYKDITSHFVRLTREPYTFDEVKDIASQYQHIVDFQKNHVGAYTAAKNNGWFENVTAHMVPLQTQWSYDIIKDIASQYPTKKEFRKGNSNAYSWALSNLSKEEYDEVTSHMEPLGNMANRLIYAFEFPDNSVYVGLTFNSKKRFKEHMEKNKSAVFDYIKQTGLKPIFKKHTEYIPKEEAIVMENQILENYKNNGWKILNRVKTGALGSSILRWNFEEVQKEALKYKTRTEFEQNSGSAYNSARNNGWLDDVTKHMGLGKKVKYSKDELIDISKQFSKLKDFRENEYGAYQAAKKFGDEFFNSITQHMSQGPVKGSIWDDFEKVKKEALKYTNPKDFKKHSSGAYKSAFRNKWYDQISKHFQYQKKWTYDNLKKEASKYRTKKEFYNGNNSAYQTAYKQGYLNDFFPPNTK